MNKDIFYDLIYKIKAMNYFLEQIKIRRDCCTKGKKIPDRDGVTYTENGKRRIRGDTLMECGREATFYLEAYITTASSFFDILAKFFSEDWSPGQHLYFTGKLLDSLLKKYPSDPFLLKLIEFNNDHFHPLKEKRSKYVHERAAINDIKNLFSMKVERGKETKMKFLTAEDDNGEEIQMCDYLENFHTEFNKLFEEINDKKERIHKLY